MKSRNSIPLLACIFLLTAVVNAQLRIGFELDRLYYLPFEPIVVDLQITNSSGNVLMFGNEQANSGSITAQLRNFQNRPIPMPNINLADELILNPGATKALQFSLNQIISLQEEGEFHLSFMISHPNLPNKMTSIEKVFNIRKGEVVMQEQVGVPQKKPNEIISMRTVSILAVPMPDTRTHLAVRIDDGQNVYRVSRLGPEISRSKPQLRVDAMSKIHIMIMVQSSLYHYIMIDVDGNILNRAYYKPNSEYTPTLVYDQVLGTVSVNAAVLAEPGRDYTID